MTAIPNLPGSVRLPAGGRPVLIVWVFVGIILCLLGITVYSAQLLATGRAFVAAESLWAKAQKDAAYHLTRHALEPNETDRRAYERAMAVIEGDRRARNEAAKPDPDRDAIRAGLTAGGVHESEVDGLIDLYGRFSTFAPMEYVLALWKRSDVLVDQLKALAARLASGPAEPTERHRIANQIHAINLSLAQLEVDFAETLAEMQRTAQAFLTGGVLIIAGVLLIGGITIARRFLAQNARLQQTLAESEAQMRHLVESAPLPLLIVRASDQRLLYGNERALEQFGLDFDSAHERSLSEFHTQPEIRQQLAEVLAREGSVRDFEAHLKDVRGRDFWMLLSAQPMRYAGAVCLLVALANIDDRKRMQEDMRRRAMHDPLTGLPNRAMFMDTLERAVHKARRRGTRATVLFIDLDRFKEVNDTMGHHAGDELLRAVGERLGTAVRQSDLVARLGGDEFVVLIEEHGGPEEVMIVAQKVLAILTRPVVIDWREVTVSGSIGIASFPEDGTDLQSLVKNADAAMYQAKERGRNNFQFYSVELNRLSNYRYELEKRIRGAIERHEFFLEYQPEVELATGKVVGVEALLRWRDPEAGVVLPAAFMPLAEETGTVVPIGEWVFERALSDLRHWNDEGLDPRVAINVSARQLQEPDLATELERAIARHGVKPQSVRIEITEPALMQDADASHRVLTAMRALGVEVAVDNFGSGYSSLGLLRGLPVQVVKLDRSLVSSCPVKRECAAIVQASAAMARAMGIRVIAEGVETEEQRRLLLSLGCDSAQGHLFYRPMEARGLKAAMTRAVAEQSFTA
jgi:diguanylate cyclase (GGDEF)-like protein/PAS domain S-box-containing protein